MKALLDRAWVWFADALHDADLAGYDPEWDDEPRYDPGFDA